MSNREGVMRAGRRGRNVKNVRSVLVLRYEKRSEEGSVLVEVAVRHAELVLGVCRNLTFYTLLEGTMLVLKHSV